MLTLKRKRTKKTQASGQIIMVDQNKYSGSSACREGRNMTDSLLEVKKRSYIQSKKNLIFTFSLQTQK